MRTLLCLALLSSLLVGCGDDGPSASPDAGNPLDQCVGASDQAILDGYLVDGGSGLSQELTDLLRGCALACDGEVLSGDLAVAEPCMSACYETTAIAGLTAGCQSCWTRSSICGGEHCAVDCLGVDPAVCNACVNEFCTPGRVACVGY